MTIIIECGDALGGCAQNYAEPDNLCGDNGIEGGSKLTDGRLTFVGFDSAWAGNPKSPGAVCAVTLVDGKPITFSRPILATFDEALAFIAKTSSDSEFTLVALDQPTIVSNLSGMRPVERVVASLISWLGGAVQPANRGRIGMFCDAAPVWKFRKALGATDDPEQARIASQGQYIIEVFSRLLLSLPSPPNALAD
jgi:predicted RNase H-like nuclease